MTRSKSNQTRREKQRFTGRRGFWVFRSHALKLFSDVIGPRDLDSILPTLRTQSFCDHPTDIMKYNLCDLAALVNRLRPTLNPDSRAPPRGRPITLTAAKNEFKLTTSQLKRIAPRDIRRNSYANANTNTTVYNRIDVEDLNERIEVAAANPTGVPIRFTYDHDGITYDVQYEPQDSFLGMTKHQAAAHFYNITQLRLEYRMINHGY